MFRKLLVAVLLILPAAALVSQDVPLQFNWAFVKRASDGSPRAVDFSQKAAVLPGDLFKISIQPVKNAFVYLLLHDASGNLQLLFPGRFVDFEGPAYLNTPAFIPDGENWFALDNIRGTERFYLLASSTRLSRLEALVLAYQKAGQGTAGADQARQAVLDEMTRLRTAHSQLTTAAEKPVTIAGGTRGADQATAKLATQITAASFYTRTFRLPH